MLICWPLGLTYWPIALMMPDLIIHVAEVEWAVADLLDNPTHLVILAVHVVELFARRTATRRHFSYCTVWKLCLLWCWKIMVFKFTARMQARHRTIHNLFHKVFVFRLQRNWFSLKWVRYLQGLLFSPYIWWSRAY